MQEITVKNKGISELNLGHRLEMSFYKFIVIAKLPNAYILKSSETMVFRSKRHLAAFARQIEYTLRRSPSRRVPLTAAEIAAGRRG
jgi:hypothetical protein